MKRLHRWVSRSCNHLAIVNQVSEISRQGSPTPPQDIVIHRTFSNQWKKHLLRWPTNESLPISYQTYSYNPTLESVTSALTLLEYINPPKTRIRLWRDLPICLYAIIHLPVLCIIHGFRLRLILAVYAHMHAIGPRRALTWSVIWGRLIRHPSYRHTLPEDMMLASRISLSVKPLKKLKGWALFGWAYILASTCVLLVIGTELTIQWNNIQNVQSLRTVGQLIPASIGVGGLVRVVYSALFESERNKAEEQRWDEMVCIGQCKRDNDRKAWKEVGEAWRKIVGWLERRESSALNLDDEKGKEKGKMAI
jgi:hypothetical protein